MIVGDGAAWIWNGELFPGAIETSICSTPRAALDAAKAIYGPGTDRPLNGPENVAANSKPAHRPSSRPSVRTELSRLRCMGYLETNRNRMRYASSVDKA